MCQWHLQMNIMVWECHSLTTQEYFTLSFTWSSSLQEGYMIQQHHELEDQLSNSTYLLHTYIWSILQASFMQTAPDKTRFGFTLVSQLPPGYPGAFHMLTHSLKCWIMTPGFCAEPLLCCRKGCLHIPLRKSFQRRLLETSNTTQLQENRDKESQHHIFPQLQGKA